LFVFIKETVYENDKMKSLAWLLALLLVAGPALAKPKVDVRIRVNDGVGKDRKDSLSRTGSSYDGALTTGQDYFLNVTVMSGNAEAVAKNNGQWCIKGDTLLGAIDYKATLEGNYLEIEVLQKKRENQEDNLWDF